METSRANNHRVDARLGESRPPLEANIERFDDLVSLRKRWAEVEAMPVLMEDRENGADSGWGGLDIRTLLRGEQSAGRFSAHSIRLAPGAGLPAHYHEDAHTYVVVADGEVELGVGKLVERIGKYGLGFIPPLVRQSFRNTSGAPATLAVLYSPAGVERAFSAAHDHWMATGDKGEEAYLAILARHGFHFDAEPLEKDAQTNVILPPVEFEIKMAGDLQALREQFNSRPAMPRLIHTTPEEMNDKQGPRQIARKEVVGGEDTGGHGMINMLGWAPGAGAPPHHQPTEEEFFFILDGELQMVCATETRVLQPGAFAFCPRNCTHGFGNPSPTNDTRFFTLNSPAGHERAMAAVRERTAAGASGKELYDLSVVGGFIFHAGPEPEPVPTPEPAR